MISGCLSNKIDSHLLIARDRSIFVDGHEHIRLSDIGIKDYTGLDVANSVRVGGPRRVGDAVGVHDLVLILRHFGSETKRTFFIQLVLFVSDNKLSKPN